MKKISFLLFFILFSLFSLRAQSDQSALNILTKAVNAISNSKGVVANFTIYNSGYSGNGEIKTLGNKFKVSFPDVSVWYNGTDLYTYNSKTNETTLIHPTAEELAESNPLAYVTGASKNYNVSFSTVKKAGKEVLELTPKKKKGIKRITLTLNKSNYYPEKIVVEPSSGSPVTAEIKTFNTMASISSAEFDYPKSKYPKVEIVDLR